MPGWRTATITMIRTEPVATAQGGLYRLLAWLSPGFPIGAFSYSHGLETAAAEGAVHDRATLETWVRAIAVRGSGRIDADIVCAAYRAVLAGDDAALAAANRRGAAYRATAELALESTQQGEAFIAAYEAAWAGTTTSLSLRRREREEPAQREGEGQQDAFPSQCVSHAAAFGAAAAGAGIALGDALTGWLQAFAANLISAGLRLGLVGQTDGQRILAALEADIAAAAAAATTRDSEDFGAATFAADLASTAHETQYTRLFRS